MTKKSHQKFWGTKKKFFSENPKKVVRKCFAQNVPWWIFLKTCSGIIEHGLLHPVALSLSFWWVFYHGTQQDSNESMQTSFTATTACLSTPFLSLPVFVCLSVFLFVRLNHVISSVYTTNMLTANYYSSLVKSSLFIWEQWRLKEVSNNTCRQIVVITSPPQSFML